MDGHSLHWKRSGVEIRSLTDMCFPFEILSAGSITRPASLFIHPGVYSTFIVAQRVKFRFSQFGFLLLKVAWLLAVSTLLLLLLVHTISKTKTNQELQGNHKQKKSDQIFQLTLALAIWLSLQLGNAKGGQVAKLSVSILRPIFSHLNCYASSTVSSNTLLHSQEIKNIEFEEKNMLQCLLCSMQAQNHMGLEKQHQGLVPCLAPPPSWFPKAKGWLSCE